MSKTDRGYISYIKNSEVIPTVLTKIKHGRVTKLEGDELEEAKKKYGLEIRKQREALEKLKYLRSELNTAQQRLEDAADDSQQKIQVKQIYKKLQDERYKDRRLGLLSKQQRV